MGRLRYTGLNRTSEKLKVTGVLVDPSGATWVVIIQDSAGNTVFSAKGADAVSRFYPINDNSEWDGCNVTTATALTAVYIYTD